MSFLMKPSQKYVPPPDLQLDIFHMLRECDNHKH